MESHGNRHHRPFTLLFLALLSSCLLFYCRGLIDQTTRLYIVYMGEKQHEDPDLVTALHHETLSSVLGSKDAVVGSLVYSYKHGFSGFAAMLTDSQAERVAELPGVHGVRPSRSLQLQTTRSWDFLGLRYDPPRSELLRRANLGDGIIIGVVDTGIWPESESFNDQGYGPVPSRWKGACQTGEQFNASHCNRKIIGARWYTGGIPASYLRVEYLSARDLNGHGTFTASTAVGSLVRNASYNGLGRGSARGGAPRARLAVYKVVWGEAGNAAGNDATLLKAVDDAIHDGVDVLSLSLGLTEGSWGTLQAVVRGITVVYSGGNDGPVQQKVMNAAPWVITVAASTIDRSFPTAITLGDNRTFVGQAIYFTTREAEDEFKGLYFGSSCAENSLSATEVRGKVVLCNTGRDLPTRHIGVALDSVRGAGGAGLIFAQYTTSLLLPYADFPCAFIDFEIHQQIVDYIAGSRSPMVRIRPTRTVIGQEVFAPKVAAFSSRGPSPVFPALLKPDVAAPGVGILAAMAGSYVLGDGTSAAAPHVSAIAALLKRLHPSWSPAAIKSAIVTTASVRDEHGVPIMAEGTPRKLADPFDYGGGHINPDGAADPGLIYDIEPREYSEFNCSWDVVLACETPQRPVYHLNLPSVSVPDLRARVTVSRTVTNVGAVNSTYKAVVEPPPGVEMEVTPSTLVFDAYAERRTFNITFSAGRRVQGVYTFGSLTWEGGRHSVRIPIAVRTVIHQLYADIA